MCKCAPFPPSNPQPAFNHLSSHSLTTFPFHSTTCMHAKSVQECARVGGSVQEYARVCKSVQECASVCKSVQFLPVHRLIPSPLQLLLLVVASRAIHTKSNDICGGGLGTWLCLNFMFTCYSGYLSLLLPGDEIRGIIAEV